MGHQLTYKLGDLLIIKPKSSDSDACYLVEEKNQGHLEVWQLFLHLGGGNKNNLPTKWFVTIYHTLRAQCIITKS